MKESIMVVDADKRTCRAMCKLLEGQQYFALPCHTLANVQGLIEDNSCRALILDLDTVPVDNRHFRDLKRTNPGLYVVTVSGRPFHPELKEALATHIYASLSKPVDPEELTYWLKSIFCTETPSGEGPAHDEWNAFR